MTYLNRNNAKCSLDKRAYTLGVIPIGLLKTKEELKKLLIDTDTFKQLTLKDKTNIEELVKNYIICPSVFKKGVKSKKDSDVLHSDFIFLDIDNGLTLEEAQKILDKEELSYIIYTSLSHTNEHNKFHILVPLRRRIEDKETYQAYWQYLHDLLNSKTDISCKVPSKACFPSSENGIVINKMYRNDLFLEAKILNEYKKVSNAFNEISSTNLAQEILSDNYMKMISNQNPDFELIQVTIDGIARFKRNKEDSVGNLFNYYSKGDKQIVDLTKNSSTDLLFSNSDFLDSLKCDGYVPSNLQQLEIIEFLNSLGIYSKEEYTIFKSNFDGSKLLRNSIQSKIYDSIFVHENCGLNSIKSVICANEGLGKSKCVISFCKDNPMIIASDTKDRLSEIESDLKKEKIPYAICFSNAEILAKLGFDDDFINLFESEMAKGTSTSDFLSSRIDNELELEKILEAIENNGKTILRKDICILLTTRKLQVLLNKYRRENLLTIILDELNISYFYPYTNIKPEGNPKCYIKDSFYKDYPVRLYKNNQSFFDLLIGKSAIILTTEYEKAKRMFYNKDGYYIKDLRENLIANNVTYLFVNSTSNVRLENNTETTKRDKLIREIKNKYPDIDTVICDASKESTHSHIAVRGMNCFRDNTTLVIGQNPTPEEQIMFYELSKDYYSNTDMSFEEIGNDINYAIITDKISQSMGRNSGFRESNAKCYVVLPILAPNSKKCFKKFGKSKMDLNLKYISPNVEVFVS